MANCIPASLDNYYHAEGEKYIFNMLKQLPDDCYVWYEVVLAERNFRPDFIVLDPKRGIFVIEVKDWDIKAIVEAGPKWFVVKFNSKTQPERTLNPNMKCQIYVGDTKGKLAFSDSIVDEKLRLLIPIDYWLVLPNLSSAEFDTVGLSKVLDKDHILFRDDVRRSSDFLANFLGRLPLLSKPVTPQQAKDIHRTLKPEITIASTKTNANGLYVQDSALVVSESLIKEFALDIEQEKIAKELGEGPRLLRGLAGSGKTLIMLMRAKLAVSNANYQGEKKRILVLCWNIALANYLRQAFDSINIPVPDDADVEIAHFMRWARNMIHRYRGEKAITRSASDPLFEDMITELLKNTIINEWDKYDAIYIDEAQDFRDNWIEYLFHRCMKEADPKARNFIIAKDDMQHIYRSRTSWSSLNIPMQGRSKILRRIYRNSVRVWSFARFFFGPTAEYLVEDGTANSKLSFAPKRGFDPQLVECTDLDNQIERVANLIQELGQNGYAYRNVLILYRSKRIREFPLVERLLEKLRENNIATDWISEDEIAKREFDWSADTVKISTVHSAKGMDAPVVIVLGAEGFDAAADETADEVKLMYVALTRAREAVYIFYSAYSVTPDSVIEKLIKANQIYVANRAKIVDMESWSQKQVIV